MIHSSLKENKIITWELIFVLLIKQPITIRDKISTCYLHPNPSEFQKLHTKNLKMQFFHQLLCKTTEVAFHFNLHYPYNFRMYFHPQLYTHTHNDFKKVSLIIIDQK